MKVAFALALPPVFLGAALLAGCKTEAYCFDCGVSQSGPVAAASTSGAGGSGGGGLFEVTVDASSAAASTAGSGGGCTAQIMTDAMNCGACGKVCDIFGAFPKCVQGACEIDTCATGHVDSNQIASDGCEYVCTPQNGGVELCNDLDDDCDGTVDEGFDKSSDPNNCGFCGNVCQLANATATCTAVGGFPTCTIDACADGFADIDKLNENGCEYGCPVFPTTAEVCNDKDDNCDGVINEGNPGGGAACDDNCPGGVCQGVCTSGTTVCSGTTLICIAGVGASAETCDGKDNDCDGVEDNGFDLQNDPLNCGSCGNVCTLAHAIGGCQAGQCVITTCLPGFSSLDGSPDNGCEYTCPVSPPTIESCNGLDDDCNGIVDDPGVVLAQKPAAALCYPTAGTPCAGADFICTGAPGWRCQYGSGVETDASGKLSIVETKCDGIDGNCNGQVDEAFADLGTACDNGLLGACRDGGKRVCDPSDATATHCDLSFLPDPLPGAPTAETCNAIDDDCNGMVDDGIVDDMVSVNLAGLDFKIDRYEASRPDATAATPGLLESRRCVTANVIPWTFTTNAEAAAACAASGARLCTEAEMTVACGGVANNNYPYGMSYQANTCNGLDFDGVAGGQNDDVLIPTGDTAMSGCATVTEGIHDLSGNAAEWTSTVTGNTGAPKNLSIYAVKGGSYETPTLGMTCQFSLSHYASNAILPDLGFRCCHD